MDTEDNWEARKDQEKKLRYAPAIAFFDQLPNNLVERFKEVLVDQDRPKRGFAML